MNLSETAFVSRREEAGEYNLRWFTPAVEVDLCGHATLAAATAMFKENPSLTKVAFHTRSGKLTATRNMDLLPDYFVSLDFPAEPCSSEASIADKVLLAESLFGDKWRNKQIVYAGRNRMDIFMHISSEVDLLALKPNWKKLSEVECRGIIVTAQSESVKADFVSRFFGPRCGIEEDPVTGSAHCCLGPYWAKLLGKNPLMAHQASSRGGKLQVTCEGDRVKLEGRAVFFSQGVLFV
eukprot:Colp12_sorted_trinity150504_noHs@35982